MLPAGGDGAAFDRGSDPPRVTVCMPTRNRANWLRESIASVLEQTFESFVLLVSDNASTDDTAEAVRSFSDARVTYLRHEHDVGLVVNHNKLLDRVESDYVIILPDDDLTGPNLLEHTVAALDAHPRAGMVHARFDVIDAGGTVVRPNTDWTYGLKTDTVESGATFIRETMIHSARVCASTAVMRTSALPRGYFDKDDYPPVDVGLWLRMASAWDMAFLARPLGAYRIHSHSHSAAQGQPIPEGYVQEMPIIDALLAVKLRFVDERAGTLSDPEELRRVARERRRREMYIRARQLTLPERRFGPTARRLLEAARQDPRMLVDGPSLRLLGASVLGRRVVRRLNPTAGEEQA